MRRLLVLVYHSSTRFNSWRRVSKTPCLLTAFKSAILSIWISSSSHVLKNTTHLEYFLVPSWSFRHVVFLVKTNNPHICFFLFFCVFFTKKTRVHKHGKQVNFASISSSLGLEYPAITFHDYATKPEGRITKKEKVGPRGIQQNNFYSKNHNSSHSLTQPR